MEWSASVYGDGESGEVYLGEASALVALWAPTFVGELIELPHFFGPLPVSGGN